MRILQQQQQPGTGKGSLGILLFWIQWLATTKSGVACFVISRNVGSIRSLLKRTDTVNPPASCCSFCWSRFSSSSTPPPLSSNGNDYFALRHGESLANVAGVIASNPQVALYQYGLSERGKEQAMQAGQQVARIAAATATTDGNQQYQGLVLVSSDFLRAKETAEIVLQQVLRHQSQSPCVPIYQNKVLYVPWLRERWFGEYWDGTSDANYKTIWEWDETTLGGAVVDVPLEYYGMESVPCVLHRVLDGLQCDVDAVVQQHMVVCIAHGDVLQILQTAFEGSIKNPAFHRRLPHLETATLRRLSSESKRKDHEKE